MRTTISFSVDEKEIQKTKKIARLRGFQSVSEYIRFLLSMDDVNLISEDEIVKRSNEVEKMKRAGALLEATSLAELH